LAHLYFVFVFGPFVGTYFPTEPLFQEEEFSTRTECFCPQEEFREAHFFKDSIEWKKARENKFQCQAQTG
jgi:hypothetical protein